MNRTGGGATLAAVIVPLLSACLEATVPAGSAACTGCHSDATSTAPFVAPGGVTEKATRGVGAHTVHLWETRWSRRSVCTDCHPAVASVDAEGHLDTGGRPAVPADVTWAASELPNGSSEPYDAAGLTCTVYCHGASSAKGPDVPVWTAEEPVACGSCHGLPPPTGDHDDLVEDSACTRCHTAATPEWERGDPAKHVDGRIDLDFPGTGTTPPETGDTAPLPGSCAAGCHGSDDDPAPSSGAHAVHVGGTGDGAAVACADCHVVPAAVGDAGHVDPAPAEVVLSGVAASYGRAPAYTPSTCTDTHCHAGSGASEPAPDWNGAGLSCGSCHGMPPPPGHPQNAACEGCHPTAGPGQTIVDPARHVDGTVDR